MFEVNGKNYSLRYDIKSIAIIEKALGDVPLSDAMSGVPTINKIVIFMGNTLYNEENNKVSLKRAEDIILDILKGEGVANVWEKIVDQIIDDVGFLFPEIL